jgi:hypothetical protein
MRRPWPTGSSYSMKRREGVGWGERGSNTNDRARKSNLDSYVRHNDFYAAAINR